MTRRGSLAYYLAAVVVGCLLLGIAGMALTRFSTFRWDSGRDLIFVYFLAVSHGWLPALLFAFILRRTAGALQWKRAWQWMLAGGCLAIVVSLTWLVIPESWSVSAQTMRWLLVFLPSGASVHGFAWGGGLGLLLSAVFVTGAAISFVLFRVHRAFEVQAVSPTTK